MPDLALETELRAAMLAWLTQRRLQTGGPISAAELREFRFRGEPLPLLHPAGRGIHKPSLLGPDGAALTLLTAAELPGRPRRYDDTEADDEGWFIYRYQGTDPLASDNRAVRRAMEHGLPLVYFRGLAKGLYEALYPAFIEHDDPRNLAFHVSMDTRDGLARDVPAVADQAAGRRYATRAAKVRLHQSLFRERVLTAYTGRCTICHLGHRVLLDAAHITPDTAAHGTPEVSNGLSLCKIHHAAYDALLLGIAPDYRVHINRALLEEIDGPMLQHGLKERHGERIRVPRRIEWQPDRDRLSERFEAFQRR